MTCVLIVDSGTFSRNTRHPTPGVGAQRRSGRQRRVAESGGLPLNGARSASESRASPPVFSFPTATYLPNIKPRSIDRDYTLLLLRPRTRLSVVAGVDGFHGAGENDRAVARSDVTRRLDAENERYVTTIDQDPTAAVAPERSVLETNPVH